MVKREGRFSRLGRSLTLRALLVAALFIALPPILYVTFRQADLDRQRLLLESIRVKGLTVGRVLEERLQRADMIPLFRLGEELARFQTEGVSLRLLFRPHDGPPDAGFLYVASAPPVPPDELEREQRELADAGVLEQLGATCGGDLPLALRIERQDGAAELISAITPVRTQRGCWALVISNDLTEASEQRLGQPYWKAPEVQIAAAIYLGFAAIVLLIAFDLWRGLRRFTETARAVAERRVEGLFAQRNKIPELQPVAIAFDRMEDSLRATASELRQAAEENAHAFKTPLGTIRQALVPLRHRLTADDRRGQQALQAIDAALDRLDGLVRAARRLDDVAADRLDPPREAVDLGALVEDVVETFSDDAATRNITLTTSVEAEAAAPRGGRLIAEALSQVIENALSFAPVGSVVTVTLHRGTGRVLLIVADAGPGVAPELLPHIFERHASFRPASGENGEEKKPDNFGLGLWLAKRNIESVGGSIVAANRPGGGFIVTIILPSV
ncbi:ATP-binding protein [uncultured Ferrovibrio sp.]|jgi:two-component system sensor histidine kinase ChvG|uniref:sensor histidine kinase n=1 Tax=uncultured Ferrovibrio sp. TaxID=1576913 RepID=UPI002630FE24|nr:ATP-binding protein [uncultured Ferrovibrio sp.]